MIENDKFSFEQVMKEGRKIVLLRGIIDEDTSFDPISKLGSPLSFNFRGLTSINSIGIRTWVNFIKSIAKAEVFYEECPPLIVRQMNMVPSFIGHAKVRSVYVPYVCEECEAEFNSLVQATDFHKVPDSMKCNACKKGEMELDGRPEQYFAFAK
jgi:hypothetical protein